MENKINFLKENSLLILDLSNSEKTFYKKNNWWQNLQLPDEFEFDLQRFASAESEGRTEKATEHKKKKAREEGKVALSKDIPAVLISLFGFITIYFLANYSLKVLLDTFSYVFENIMTLDINDPNLVYDILLIPSVKIFIPIAIIAVIIGIVANYAQIGFKVTPKAIKPNFKKLIPDVFKFFKSQVFSVTSAFNLIKSLLKVAIICAISYALIIGKIEQIKNLMNIDDIFYCFSFIAKMGFDLIMQVLVVLLVIALADYIFVRWQYEEQLKMKKQEIKEEYKEMYGDPNVKNRLKQMYQTLLNQKKMLGEVPKADVVITNPTHYAVALKYDSIVDEAPRVIAKGEDEFAQKIKEVARQHNIFMYENIMLARTLYAEVEINDIIPRPMYSLVINAYKLALEHKEKEKVGVS